MPRRLLQGLCSFLIGLTALTAALQAQSSPIRYVYDELGRLVAVIDSSGQSAVYTYDAVGNLLSIARYASSAVTVIEFTPNGGPAGTVVTIQGVCIPVKCRPRRPDMTPVHGSWAYGTTANPSWKVRMEECGLLIRKTTVIGAIGMFKILMENSLGIQTDH